MHLMLHDYDSMHNDYEAVTAIDQNTLEIEKNDDYLVLKNISISKINDLEFRENYASEMISRGYCKSIHDITFTNNGVAIIKLKRNCGCQKCQDEQSSEKKT